MFIPVSPTLPGSVPATVLPPSLGGDFNTMQSVTQSQPTILSTHSATIIPPQPGTAARSGAYLPSPFHPFAHPDFLCKNPFLPYDLAALRGVSMNGRPIHHIQHNTSLQSESAIISNQTPEHLSTSRLSPTSSRPSSSSPPSSAHSDPIKMHISIDMNESEDSDDEQIDVVKSAFVPILRPNPAVQSIVGVADSTTVTDQVDASIPRVRCDLKAPSSRKPVHETAPTGPRSPETKIKSPISAQKTVWRPY